MTVQEPLALNASTNNTEAIALPDLGSEQTLLLENFGKLAGLMLQARRASLYVYDNDTGQFYPFYHYQSAGSSTRRVSRDRNRETRPLDMARNQPPTTPSLAEANPAPVSNDFFEQFLANSAYNEGSSLSYPITLENRPFGFFRAEEREDNLAYTEREQLMLELLMQQLVKALKPLLPTSDNISATKSNLPDEAYLQAHLPSELERARRHKFNLSLMGVTLNISLTELLPNNPDSESAKIYLQEIVQHIARAFRRNLRSFDLVCQNENDEFSIVLPHTSEIESYYVARKLINQVSEDISLSPVMRRAIALVIGISTYPILANNAPVLVKQSRQAMNQARRNKNNGHAVYVYGSSRHFDLRKLEEIKDEAVARAMLRGFNSVSVALEAILPNAIPWEISRQYLCLAVQERQAVLTVAMADPNDSALITMLARTTGRSIVPLVAPRAEIEATLAILEKHKSH